MQKTTTIILLVFCFTGSLLHSSEEEQEIAFEFYPQWYSQEDYTVQNNIGIEETFSLPKDFRVNEKFKEGNYLKVVFIRKIN